MAAAWRRCLCWAAVMAAAVCGGGVEGGKVTYDRRSLIIDGKRQILFSGSIHYPRSTPEMWPDLIAKAKQGGIDVIQTYVFWNLHEPQPGQYDFSGRSDLIKFIKEVKNQGLYVTLRIGPFIEAEWNYGGLPVWLRFVPNIVYRSDNEPFKFYMQRFTTKIVNMMQSEGLYASQGGPIILSQIENEYQNIEAAFGAKGPRYVTWAAKMAVGLNTGVPWVMCKQSDAPDPVINACNGMRCGETFAGPNSPKKPAIWTENWTSFFQTYGAETYIRSAEDIAFHVALFIAKLGGSYINYYMYHGGTNLGRTGSAFVITSYYDEAPLDEYGLIREPKWSHLKELHAAIKVCSRPLLEGVHSNYSIGKLQQAYVFQEEKRGCAAFLVNNDGRHNVKVQFKKSSFDLLPKSVTLLKDCATVIFSTAKVSTGFNKRTTVPSQILNSADKWKKFRDVIPNFKDTSIHSKALQEQLSMTRDTTDYLWYTFSLQPESRCLNPVLFIESLGHVAHVFVNKAYAGYAHGSPKSNGFTFEPQIKLHNGVNSIAILSVMVGLRDSGAFLEKKHSGLNKVHIQCSQQKSTITNFTWGYQVGLLGEKSRIYGEEHSGAVEWSSGGISTQESLTWYKAEFKTPPGHNPVVLNLSTMRKGEAWVNGQTIGRYWVSYHTPKGHPSQSLYHVPRSFLETTKSNVLVLFEEVGGNPLLVSVNTVSAHQPPLAAHLSSP